MAKWKMRSASETFAKAIQLRSRSRELYLLKATADEGRGATEDAIAACQKVLELDPDYAEAYAEIGDVLQHNKKRRSEAIAAYESALKINPRLLSVYEFLGQTVLLAEDEKRAENCSDRRLPLAQRT